LVEYFFHTPLRHSPPSVARFFSQSAFDSPDLPLRPPRDAVRSEHVIYLTTAHHQPQTRSVAKLFRPLDRPAPQFVSAVPIDRSVPLGRLSVSLLFFTLLGGQTFFGPRATQAFLHVETFLPCVFFPLQFVGLSSYFPSHHAVSRVSDKYPLATELKGHWAFSAVFSFVSRPDPHTALSPSHHRSRHPFFFRVRMFDSNFLFSFLILLSLPHPSILFRLCRVFGVFD